jgi:hypothetical protein
MILTTTLKQKWLMADRFEDTTDAVEDPELPFLAPQQSHPLYLTLHIQPTSWDDCVCRLLKSLKSRQQPSSVRKHKQYMRFRSIMEKRNHA